MTEKNHASEAAASSYLPSEAELQHIATPGGGWSPRVQAMAVEILRMRRDCPPTAEVEKLRHAAREANMLHLRMSNIDSALREAGRPCTRGDEVERIRDLADDRDAWKHKADTLGGDLNRIRSLVPTASDEQTTFDAVQAELQRLRAELVQFRQAIGLMATAKPDMQVDANDPIGMAHQVVEVVEQLRAEVERLRAENDRFVRCINAIQEPSLPAEAQTAIAAMRDVGPELAKAGIQVGPRLSHAEAIAQLRGERDRWREKCVGADKEAGSTARWILATCDRLAGAGFDWTGAKSHEAGLHRAVIEALAELARLRKESKRDQVAKQQALLDEIARLFPGKGPLLERVKHSAKVDEPQLGLATTKQLLEELQARAEVGGYASYRTVGGEDADWLEAMRRTEPKRDVALAPIRGLVDEAVRKVGPGRVPEPSIASTAPYSKQAQPFGDAPCNFGGSKIAPATGQPRTEVPLAADGSGTVVELGEAFRQNLSNAVACLPEGAIDPTTIKIAIRNLHACVAEMAKVVERIGAR